MDGVDIVERSKPRMSETLETGIEGVGGENGGSEVEDMKDVLEVDDVERRLGSIGGFRDMRKRSSTTSREWDRVEKTWFLSFFTLFLMIAAADVEKARWWRSTSTV
jgi:hypothetical protein